MKFIHTLRQCPLESNAAKDLAASFFSATFKTLGIFPKLVDENKRKQVRRRINIREITTY